MLPENIAIPQIMFDPIWLVKILIYLIIVGFLIYALFKWRQVMLASRVLKTQANPMIKFLSLLYVGIVVFVGVVVIILINL